MLSTRMRFLCTLSRKRSFTEHPARPEDAQAQAQAQWDAQAQEDAHDEAQEERETQEEWCDEAQEGRERVTTGTLTTLTRM